MIVEEGRGLGFKDIDKETFGQEFSCFYMTLPYFYICTYRTNEA